VLRVGSTIFLYSDEETAGFFERPPLSTQYDLRVSFSGQLGALMTGAEWSLYARFEVEKLVARDAKQQLETFPHIATDPAIPLVSHDQCAKGYVNAAADLKSRSALRKRHGGAALTAAGSRRSGEQYERPRPEKRFRRAAIRDVIDRVARP
jgi:hypothetical protein